MKRALILVADEYQDLEVWYPVLRLREAGWTVSVAGVEAKRVYKGKYGYPITADTLVETVNPDDYDCLIIPGGWAPDYIRRNSAAVQLVRELNRQKKTVGAICHGAWVLASAGILKGRNCTSFFAIRDDIMNAGAEWIDAEVVVDHNLVTSRRPEDLPAFCRAILEQE